MDLQLAAIIAHDTREQAIADARTDLHRLQQQAIEAGRDESRRLIKVSHINRTTGQATYRPAGRLLRDWYLHCYTNNLRHRLGSPAVTIDAQQVEDTTALLHRLAPNQSGIAALRAVAVLRNIADADAAHATVSIATTLHANAANRAIVHAPESRFDGDQLRVHVVRHWYMHSYLDYVDIATRSAHPYTATGSAERQVALTLTSRTIHPLVFDAAMTPTAITGVHPDHLPTGAHLDSTADPRLAIIEGPPEEAARLMFGHGIRLQKPAGRGTEIASGSDQRLGLYAPATDSESRGRSLPTRTA